MDEIESTGGFLICVESRLADQWRGIDGISVKPDASIKGVVTDYDRACRIFVCTPPEARSGTYLG